MSDPLPGRGTLGPAEEPTDITLADAIDVSERRDENVFEVLGAHARARPALALSVAAIGAAVDAALLVTQHPGLAWLAAGCASVASYGLWGILDRAALRSRKEAASTAETLWLGARNLAAVLGTVSAAWAVWAFMAAAIGNWIL